MGRDNRFLREQLSTLRGVVADPSLPQGMLHGDIFPDNGTHIVVILFSVSLSLVPHLVWHSHV
jgi:hypothetical protein